MALKIEFRKCSLCHIYMTWRPEWNLVCHIYMALAANMLKQQVKILTQKIESEKNQNVKIL